jgi:type VI secretion system Hcp family effector
MKRTSWLISCVLALAACPATAQISSYLEIPGLPGESTRKGHENWIDIKTVSVSVADQACHGVALTKDLDKSSPLLSGAALTGGFYAKMTIDVERVAEPSEVILTYVLDNVTVTAVQTTTTTTSPALESVHLSPSKITMTYKPPGALPSAAVSFTLTCVKK